ncbi:conserved hypothetical protein [Mesorhizobium plurifarium]|uniref:Uncharacterized protein n=1 Tax=Mesorhizobium plurifarium TaxID=69974 RepID=A0A090F4D6_MESPL|nr:conserved hypothetical protein [Mesorhizobium plurifarium]
MGMLSTIATLLGRGSEDALSVPAMDGVFKPNTLLDSADRVLELPQIDNLAATREGLYCSSGETLFAIDPASRRAELVRQFKGEITMAAASPSGRLAVGVQGSGLEMLDKHGWRHIDLPADCARCVTAGLFGNDDTLYLAIGSRRHAASDWKRDLMSHGASGAILRYRISTGESALKAEGMAFPYGIALLADGGLAVSESWRHRIATPGAGARSRADILIGDLPAYPARLAPASDGGFWLALFAPRRQLTEFVLSEDDYRREMMTTIPSEAWIGPDFADNGGDEQPLQAGSVRQMGIMKPWAPSRSYGMVVRLDSRMKPLASLHSRADGRMHGIASVAEFRGVLYAASRGGGTLLGIATGMETAP